MQVTLYSFPATIKGALTTAFFGRTAFLFSSLKPQFVTSTATKEVGISSLVKRGFPMSTVTEVTFPFCLYKTKVFTPLPVSIVIFQSHRFSFRAFPEFLLYCYRKDIFPHSGLHFQPFFLLFRQD